MNLFSISSRPDYPGGISRAGGRHQTEAAWKDGDEVSAVLTEKSGGSVTLVFDEQTQVKVPSDSVKGNVGDTVTFKVRKNKDGLSLTQISLKQQPEPKPRGDADMARMAGKNIEHITESDDRRLEENKEAQAKTAQAVSRIRHAQNYMSDTASRSVISALIESGVSLDKIDFSSFDRVLHEVKKQAVKEMSREELKAAMKENYLVREDAADIAKSLHRHGLQINRRNIRKLESTRDKIPEEVSDEAAEKLIAEESELTVDGLYKASHTGAGRKATDGEKQSWQAPESEIKRLFEREGIRDGEENVKAARFMQERDLPINRDNVEKLLFLRRFSSEISKTALFDKAAEYIANDLPAGSIPLAEIVSQVSEARHMAENQLKLTSEAALRRQDISINTEYLRRTVKDLGELDDDMARRFLRMANANDSEENVSALRKVMDTVADIKPLTANVFPGVMRGRVRFSLSGIHETVTDARARYGAAVGEYERFATVPAARFGDSVNSLRSEFAGVLTANGIAATAANERAAFILNRSMMDVTADNVRAVTEIDAKIDSITKNLHPAAVAQMIKDGLQPLNMHADEVLSYMKKFNREMGEGGTEAIARHIMEMDGENTLDADTREQVVAVYRMLHVIQKDGAAALGLAARQESPLTLGGLMELSKYLQNSRRSGRDGSVFDKSADEGYLEKISRPEGGIRSILERDEITAEEFSKAATPERMQKWIESGNTNTPLEELIEDVPLEDAGYNFEAAENQVKFFATVTPAIINFLQNRNIPATAGNIRALQKLSRSGDAMADSLNEADDGEQDSDLRLDGTGLESLKNGETHSDIIARAWSRLDGKLPTRPVAAAKEILALQDRLNGENGFSIPIRVNGKVSKLSLFVLNERALKEDGAKVFMSLDTKSLGRVLGYFSINNGGLDVKFSAGDAASASALSRQLGKLESLLDGAGLKLNSVEVSAEETDGQTPDMPDPERQMRRIDLSKFDYLA